MAQRKKEIIVLELPAKKGRWYIYASISPGRKRPTSFVDIAGRRHRGFYEFGTRLVANNGNKIAGNVRQFNTVAGAIKNINAVKNSA